MTEIKYTITDYERYGKPCILITGWSQGKPVSVSQIEVNKKKKQAKLHYMRTFQRKQGFGGHALKNAEEFAKKEGATRLLLESVRKPLNGKTSKTLEDFYEKRGFKHHFVHLKHVPDYNPTRQEKKWQRTFNTPNQTRMSKRLK